MCIGLVLQLDCNDDEADFGVNFCDRMSSTVNCAFCDRLASDPSIQNSEDVECCNDSCRIANLLKTNVRVVRLDSSQARGPCWARHIGQSLWWVKFLMHCIIEIYFSPSRLLHGITFTCVGAMKSTIYKLILTCAFEKTGTATWLGYITSVLIQLIWLMGGRLLTRREIYIQNQCCQVRDH